MLNRIVNISAGSDFKSATKPYRGAKYDRAQAYHIYDGHDSIAISPAYNFLLKHNWKIKEMNIEDDKLFINFFITDFEFITNISLKQINQLTNIEYTVIKEKEFEDVLSKIAVDFIVNLSNINYNEVDYIYNLSKIEIFFNRLMHLKLKGELSSSERKVLDGLLEGLAQGIQDEFNVINNSLFIFIEKYFDFKISGGNNKININNSVFLTKIRPVY
jgi:hypothetical protein